MLDEPAQSPYDWNFRLAGTPVRISPWFWFVSAIMGWNLMQGPKGGLHLVAIWVACCFVSILLHEFGHVWAGRLFGANGHIVLYSFGGLAIEAKNTDIRWQRVFVSLAGPAIQLVAYGILWAVMRFVVREKVLTWPDSALMAFLMLQQINLYWPLFNLLPVWPLDGGQISSEVCQHFNWENGFRLALKISIATAAFLVINTLLAINGKQHVPYAHGSDQYVVILFGILGLHSYQLLMHMSMRNRYDDREPWQQ